MKAYIVRETYGDGCCVQFAEQNVVARREGATELNADFSDVECNRYPAFDEHAPGPVPDQVLVAHGWWFECMHCGQKISNEPTDHDGEPILLDPIYAGDWIFCTPGCDAAFRAEKAAEKARAESAAAEALAKWPGITIRHTNGYEQPARVWFSFPGGEGQVDWKVGESTALVERRDVDAWHKFAESVRPRATDPTSEKP